MVPWPFKLVSGAGKIVVLVYVVWLVWDHLGPRKPEVGPPLQQVARTVMPEIVEDIRTNRSDLRRVALLSFDNDYSDYFTDELRKSIEQSGILDLRNRTPFEKARNLLNLRHPSYTGTESALSRGHRLNVQGVIYGKIHSFEVYPKGSNIDVEIHLAEVSSGAVVFSNRYTMDRPSVSSFSLDTRDAPPSFPWFQRLFAWLLAVLLLPVFTISFIRKMVARSSNQVNAMVLAIYTLACAMLAWILLGAALTSWLPVLIFITAVGLALLYNIWIMTFAQRLEEK